MRKRKRGFLRRTLRPDKLTAQDDLRRVPVDGCAGRRLPKPIPSTVFVPITEEISAMETPNVSTALRRTRRNVIAMGKLVGVAVFGIAMSPRSGEAVGSGGKPCFLKGTRIRVGGGEKRIEDIRIGDLVFTKSGIAKPVRW